MSDWSKIFGDSCNSATEDEHSENRMQDNPDLFKTFVMKECYIPLQRVSIEDYKAGNYDDSYDSDSLVDR